MKQWTVTYREKSGVKTSVVIEAEDRAGVFAELKQRGINAISIAEGVVKAPRRAKSSLGGGVTSKSVWAIVAAMVVAAIGVVVWLSLSTDDKVEIEEAPKPKAVKTPAPMPEKPKPVKVEKPEEPAPVKIDPNARPTKVGETVNGYIKLPSGRLHKVRGVITNSVSAIQTKGKYEIFEHHCENEIACLLTIQPGQGLVGTPRYNGRFTKEFLESLKKPIVINDDDSEEDKELKRNVNLAKQELKAAYDRGEDIEKIMLDTRREYQDLAMYKQELRQLIYEYKKTENPSDQDVEDYVTAANKLLEAKGIAPLNIGPISRRKLMMMREEALRDGGEQNN
ncbi:MAG: hypothetical protein J6Q84_08325 [Kiritimatiellae bacterium]|nr:hypothetical protein [Kiritimatiellia bacterium]